MTAAQRSTDNDRADATDADAGGGFGAFLQSQREARGISLLQVAARTNIQPEILANLEAERLDQLPEPVYIKGFLKAYAEAIGVAPQEAILRYERRDAAYRQALSARQIQGRRRLVRRAILLTVGLACAITLATVAMPPGSEKADEPASASSTQGNPAADTAQTGKEGGATIGGATDPASTPQLPTQTQAGAQTKPKAGPIAKQPYILTAVGLKDATLKIIVDGKRPKVYRLKPDTRLEIEAQREFNILLDDARAVTLYLNGQAVSVPGREGKQVTLQLP